MTPLVLLVAAAIAAAPSPTTQERLAGAALGKSREYYRAHFGVYRIDRIEGGLTRLVWGNRRIEVYFGRRPGGIGIVTWDRRWRTKAGVGPCSPVAALHRAYGSKLVPFRFQGRIVGYRLGRLTFSTEGARIGAVQLSTDALSPFAALNAPECGAPGA